MARDKAKQRNIDKSDLANYPNARIRNNSGSNDGTPISESVYGDFHETAAKMMREANMTYNDLPDNVSNGYQLFEANKRIATKNDYVGSATIQGVDTIYFDTPLDCFKVNESMIFNVNFDSTTVINKATCVTPNFTKTIVISGPFKSGQKVRLINESSRILLSGIYETSDIPNLLSRLNALEGIIGTMNKIITPIVNGGTPLLWMRPANEIPLGYSEVTEFRGKSIFGYDPNDTDFNVVFGTAGSKSFNIQKQNLPAEGISYEDSYMLESSTSEAGINGKTTLPSNYFSWRADRDTNNNTLLWRKNTTDNLGNGNEIKKLDPSRIVMFIKYTG